METVACKKCGLEIHEWVPFCPNCSEPVEGYANPAGFWIRAGAYIIDFLIFIPIGILSAVNLYVWKNTMILVSIAVPGLFYKPLMESFCGATLGKMACKLKVVDDKGKKLSLLRAYTRFLPFLAVAAFGLAGQLVLFSSEQFQSATTMMEIGKAQQASSLGMVTSLVNFLVLVECVVAGFTLRKRAVHDYLADSFCVYKDS